MHPLQVVGGDEAGPSRWAQLGQVVVELADHRFGEGLAQFVLVGIVGHPVAAAGRAELVGDLGQQTGGPAVFDDLAEEVEQQSATLRRVHTAVGPSQVGHGVDDAGEVAGTQLGRVHPPGGGQGLGGGPAGVQRLAEPLQVGPVAAGPVLDRLPQPRQLDGPEIDDSLGRRPAT